VFRSSPEDSMDKLRRGCSPDKDHLLFELTLLVELGTYFPVEMEELLYLLVFGGQDVLDDGHEELRLAVAIEGTDDDSAQRVELHFVGSALKGISVSNALVRSGRAKKRREKTYRRSCVVAWSATSSATNEKHGSSEVDAMRTAAVVRDAVSI
jgi:hypothetical protein